MNEDKKKGGGGEDASLCNQNLQSDDDDMLDALNAGDDGIPPARHFGTKAEQSNGEDELVLAEDIMTKVRSAISAAS